MISNLALYSTDMRYSTCRYLTHAHVQNRWQQTNNSTWQKQNNLEQSLIGICYQHLSHSLKLAVKKCIIEYYIKQPDMLIIWRIFFQNMKVSNWYWKLFPSQKGKLIKHTQSYNGERGWRLHMNRGSLSSFHSSWLRHWLWVNIHGNQFLINFVYSDPCWKQELQRNIDLRAQEP